MGDYALSLVQAVVALALVCGLAWVSLRWAARHGLGGGRGERMRVLERLPLDPRRSLFLVRVGSRVLLVGSGDGGAPQLLAELDPAEVPEPAAPARRPGSRWLAGLGALTLTWLAPAPVAAQDTLLGGGSVVTLVGLAALSLLPLAFMATTSFVKISVVFSILRNALGTGQVPSGLVIAALALILSLYVMSPVGTAMHEASAPALAQIDRRAPLEGDSLDAVGTALTSGAAPLSSFLARNAGQRERALFLDLARRVREPDRRDEVGAGDLLVVLPAFLITELAEAFQIGFLVFVPFLVVDMVVANVLLALGMHMLSPTTISMPFKLLLFVLVDGWYLLARALVLGYA